jgi:hypothetical protein
MSALAVFTSSFWKRQHGCSRLGRGTFKNRWVRRSTSHPPMVSGAGILQQVENTGHERNRCYLLTVYKGGVYSFY